MQNANATKIVLCIRNIKERFYGDFMFEPCYEHCYLRFGKQYTPDCDDKCAYAKAIKERDKAVEFIKYLDNNYSSYMTEDEKFEEWR